MNLSAHVTEFLRRHGLAQSTGVVAISGGPDSVVLAHLLIEQLLAGKLERLILAHVNHQLRGDESDVDESFVQSLPRLWQLADDRRLICHTTRIDMAALALAEQDNLESIARRERYRWLTELAQQEGGAWIATGHTADDQAETVLFRLLRGSGVLGLAAIPEHRALAANVALIRPLLEIRRRTVHDYLRDNRLPCRVDGSNGDLRFTRNRLRLELLPLLEREYNPAVIEILCRLAEQARELHGEAERQALNLLTEAELPRAGKVLVFSVERLQDRTSNEVREMFRFVWQREEFPMGEMSFERWQRLAEIVQGSPSAGDFPGKIHVRRSGRVVQVVTE